MLAGEAVACTCIAAPTEQRFEAAEAAFIGRLLTTKAPPDSGPVINLGREITYVFTVDNVLKGDLGRRVEIRSPASGAACGFEVQPDEATGILLRREGGQWIGGLCGQISVGDLLEAAEGSDQPLVNWGGAVLGGIVVLLGGLLLTRRVRRRRAALG